MKRIPVRIWPAVMLAAVLTFGCGSKNDVAPGDLTGEGDASRTGESTAAGDHTSGIPSDKGDGAAGANRLDDREYRFDNVHFEFDQYRLTPEARRILTAHAKVLLENGGWTVVIEGHCDERGTVEYNLALGEKRAAAARDFLVQYGVPASRLRIISYGKERPVATGSTEEAWAVNRRCEFKVTR